MTVPPKHMVCLCQSTMSHRRSAHTLYADRSIRPADVPTMHNISSLTKRAQSANEDGASVDVAPLDEEIVERFGGGEPVSPPPR